MRLLVLLPAFPLDNSDHIMKYQYPVSVEQYIVTFSFEFLVHTLCFHHFRDTWDHKSRDIWL